MLRLLMVFVVACALSAEAQDGCTQSDCTTASVRVLSGALPTCNYSRTGTIRQDRDGGVYVCVKSPDAGRAWYAVGAPDDTYWYDGGTGEISSVARATAVVGSKYRATAGVAYGGGFCMVDGSTYSAAMTATATGGFGVFTHSGQTCASAVSATPAYQIEMFGKSFDVLGTDWFIQSNGGFKAQRAAASFPTCNATYNGRWLFDTTANRWRSCDAGGSSWHYVAQQWTFSGWLPSLGSTTVVSIAETVAATNGVVYSIHVKPPVGLTDRTGGNVVYTVYDVTSSTVLCSLTIACAAGSGSTTSCTGAVVAGDVLRLRADQTGCTGGTVNTEANVVAGVKGGL